MTTLQAFGAAAPEICRGWLQVGIGALIQSTLLIAVGLAAGRLLHSRGAVVQSLIYRATLGAVAAVALASLLLAGSFRSPDGQSLSFGRTFREYSVQGIPSVAVIDRRGKVAYMGNFVDEAVGSLGPLLAMAPGD